MLRLLWVTAVAAGLGAALGAPTRAELPEVNAELVAEGLKAPIFLVEPEDGSGRLFIGEQSGEIYVLGAEGALRDSLFLDLRDRMVELLPGFDERGLLGMALHPEFAENGLFYVTYSARLRPDSDFTGETAYTRRVSEFRVSDADPDRADPDSRKGADRPRLGQPQA